MMKKFLVYLLTFHENKLIADFKEKIVLFNSFFGNQCTLFNNSSIDLLDNLPELTGKSLDSINFSANDIARIISNLNPNNDHGHDILSIRMIKLCENSICNPLLISFNDCLNNGKFLSG